MQPFQLEIWVPAYDLVMMFGDESFFANQLACHLQPGRHCTVQVMVHSSNGDSTGFDAADWPLEPFQLTNVMWICRLPKDRVEEIYNATEPTGHPPLKMFRQYSQLYSIVSFDGPPIIGQLAGWDQPYGQLRHFAALANLVHPTTLGLKHTVRLIYDSEGFLLTMEPGPCRGFTEEAVMIPPNRNWLSRAECERIKRLLATTNFNSLPDKVSRANWASQMAEFQLYFELRLSLTVNGLDALLHTSRLDTGGQFIARTQLLASKVGFSFSESTARYLWEHRSELVHGGDIWSHVAAKDRPRYQLTGKDPHVTQCSFAAQLLRETILRCLEDQEFAAMFSSNDSVDRNFPIVRRSKKAKRVNR